MEKRDTSVGSVHCRKRKRQRICSTCGKVTKGTAREETGILCKRRSIGKRIEEGRREGGSAHGQAIRSITRMEEEFSRRVKEENRGTLWKKCHKLHLVISPPILRRFPRS